MFKEVKTNLRSYKFKIPDIDEFMELKELYTILSSMDKTPEFSEWLFDYLILAIDDIKVTKFYLMDLEKEEVAKIKMEIQEIVKSLNQGKCCVCGQEIKEEYILCRECVKEWAVCDNNEEFLSITRKIKTSLWAKKGNIISYINEFGEVEKITLGS